MSDEHENVDAGSETSGETADTAQADVGTDTSASDTAQTDAGASADAGGVATATEGTDSEASTASDSDESRTGFAEKGLRAAVTNAFAPMGAKAPCILSMQALSASRMPIRVNQAKRYTRRKLPSRR